MKLGHFCGCLDCQVELCRAAGFVVDDRPRSEGHVGVRFGDADRGLRVRLDGELVDDVVEAYTRRDGRGWLVQIAQPPHVCERCGLGVCVRFRFGDVRILQVVA